MLFEKIALTDKPFRGFTARVFDVKNDGVRIKKSERRYLDSLNKISDTSPPEKAFDLPDIMVGRREKRRRHTAESRIKRAGL